MSTTALARGLIAVLSLLLFSTDGAVAETTSGSEARELRLEQLKERLALTGDQEAKIKPLVEERNAKLREVRDRHAGDTSRSAKRGMLREVREVQADFDAQLQPILNEQQREQLEEMRIEARRKARERVREHRQ